MHFSLIISINKDRSAAKMSLFSRLFPIVSFEIILCGAKLFEMHSRIHCVHSANIIFYSFYGLPIIFLYCTDDVFMLIIRGRVTLPQYSTIEYFMRLQNINIL